MSSLTIHHKPDPHANTNPPDPHQDTFSKTVLGFWLYLMTDCVIFATLFATYAVLKTPSGEVFELTIPFIETMILLTSSLTCGFIVLSAKENKRSHVIGWMITTFLLGCAFISLELHEFSSLLAQGNSWTKNAFLSAFFTLVGTHGLHVSFGLLWLLVMVAQTLTFGINANTFRRLVVFSLFWHFLDVIWIFIFTFVYLFGVY